MSLRISVDQQKLADFCRRNGVMRFSFFGSVLRDDFRKDSDVDVLLEFKEGQTPGFMGLGRIEDELSRILGGARIDIVTPSALNHRIRDRILSEAVLQYEER